MKKEYSTIPLSMANIERYGFSWIEFVVAIPQPLFVATSYKSNGKPNACLQSWSSFSNDDNGFYAILSQVRKCGHLYQTIKEKGEVVLNFPSPEVYELCGNTIDNNGFDDDEITLSGLTAEPATIVDAPRIKECFLSLECRYSWERDLSAAGSHVLLCLEVVNVCMDETYLDEATQGRYGKTGYCYNIHYPVNPENYEGKSFDAVGVLQKLSDTISEYHA